MDPLLRTAIKALILFISIASVQSQDEGGKYLLHYQNLTGFSFLIPAASTLDNITTLEDCAKNCNQTTDIACRSFVFCDSSKTCALYTEHVLDLDVGTDIQADDVIKCALYTTNTYVEDFYDVSSICIDDPQFTVTGKALETCAQECSKQREKCNSFNYALLDSPDASRCTLTRFAPSMKNYPPATYDPLCFNYEKKFKVVDNSTTVEPGDIGTTIKPGDGDNKPGGEDNKPGFTTADIMGIVGGIIGLMLILYLIGFYGRRYYNRNYSTSIQRSKI